MLQNTKVNKTILLALATCLLLVSNLYFVSATTFDNVIEQKVIEKDKGIKIGDVNIDYKELWEKYKPIKIDNLFGLGGTLMEGAITEHTESCGNDCSSEIIIKLNEDSALIDDIRFKRLVGDNWVDGNVRNYHFYIKTDEEEIDVDDYDYVCSPTGKVSPNGTIEEKCKYEVIGTHKENKPLWEVYNIGDIVDKGVYTLKLEAEKRAEWTYDWQIETQGKWINSWAVWGANTGMNIDYGAKTGDSGGDANGDGWNITVKTPIIIGELFFYNSINGTAYITKNGNVLETATISNGKASFSYYLPIGQYLIQGNATSGAKTTAYKDGQTKTDNAEINITQWCENYAVIGECSGDTKLFGLYALNYSYNNSGSVTLNSPDNDYISPTNLVSFNATAGVTGGATLTNMSLWTNSTGTWARNKTNIISRLNDGYGVPFTASSGGNNGAYFGIKILALENKKITGFTLGYGGTETNCAILNSSGSVVATGTILGHECTIDYDIVAGNEYGIVTKDGISDYKEPYSTFPVTDTYGIYNLTGCVNNNAFTTACLYSVSNISFDSVAIEEVTFNLTLYDPTLWGIEACDSDGDCGFSENRTISMDTSPPTITIDYPSGNLGYLVLGQNLSLNYSIIDTNIDSCWIDYNNTNSTIPCEGNSSIIITTQNNFTIFANDSVGNMNYTNKLINYTIFQSALGYNQSTYATETELFTANVTTNGLIPTIAYLYYNGNKNLAVISSAGGNNYLANVSLVVPSTNGTYNFKWMFTMNNGIQYNSSEFIQNVSNLVGIQVNTTCISGTTPTFFFNFANETNLISTNASIKYNIKYGLSGNTTGQLIYGSLENINNFSVCINNSAPTYTVGYGEIQYSLEGYTDRRFYIFENTRATNLTVSNTLHFLPNSLATSFLITIQDNSLNNYIGYYASLLRWYPSINQYKVVEMGKTDDKGQTIFRVKTEDVDYRIGVYSTNGTLIHLIAPIRMLCLASPCSYAVYIPSLESDYTLVNDIQYSLTYNNDTSIVTFTFNDPSQSTSAMTLVVKKFNSEIAVCNTTTSSFTGILTCDLTGKEGTYYAYIYRSASPSKPLTFLEITRLASTFINSSNGKTMMLFFMMMLVVLVSLIGIYSPVVSIVLSVFILIPAYLFGGATITLIAAFAIAGGVIIHFMKTT